MVGATLLVEATLIKSRPCVILKLNFIHLEIGVIQKVPLPDQKCYQNFTNGKKLLLFRNQE